MWGGASRYLSTTFVFLNCLELEFLGVDFGNLTGSDFYSSMIALPSLYFQVGDLFPFLHFDYWKELFSSCLLKNCLWEVGEHNWRKFISIEIYVLILGLNCICFICFIYLFIYPPGNLSWLALPLSYEFFVLLFWELFEGVFALCIIF